MLADHPGKLEAIEKLRHARHRRGMTAISQVSNPLKGLASRGRLDRQIFSEPGEDRFVAQELGRLIIHKKDVDRGVGVHGCVFLLVQR